MLTKSEIDAMNPDERVELAIMLWDSVYSLRAQQPLTETQKIELDRRLQYDESHPETLLPVEEFMSKYAS